MSEHIEKAIQAYKGRMDEIRRLAMATQKAREDTAALGPPTDTNYGSEGSTNG